MPLHLDILADVHPCALCPRRIKTMTVEMEKEKKGIFRKQWNEHASHCLSLLIVINVIDREHNAMKEQHHFLPSDSHQQQQQLSSSTSSSAKRHPGLSIFCAKNVCLGSKYLEKGGQMINFYVIQDQSDVEE